MVHIWLRVNRAEAERGDRALPTPRPSPRLEAAFHSPNSERGVAATVVNSRDMLRQVSLNTTAHLAPLLQIVRHSRRATR